MALFLTGKARFGASFRNKIPADGSNPILEERKIPDEKLREIDSVSSKKQCLPLRAKTQCLIDRKRSVCLKDVLSCLLKHVCFRIIVFSGPATLSGLLIIHAFFQELGVLLNRLQFSYISTHFKISGCSFKHFDFCLFRRAWQPRRVVMTRDAIHFAFQKQDNEIDRIPLSEITAINAMLEKEADASDWFSSLRCEDMENGSHILRIKTEPGGHNSGRVYYLRAELKEDFTDIIEKMKVHAKAAHKRAKARTAFQRAQLRVRRIYEARWTQVCLSWIIGLVRR